MSGDTYVQVLDEQYMQKRIHNTNKLKCTAAEKWQLVDLKKREKEKLSNYSIYEQLQ